MKTGKGVRIGVWAAGVSVALVLVVLAFGGFGKNDVQNWQVIQSVMGDVSVRNEAGFYLRKFATVWTYPRAVQREFKQAGRGNTTTRADKTEDQSIPITFNDGGKAKIDCMIRFQTPLQADQRRTIHEEFGAGSPPISGVTQAVRSHLINCAKATAPLMSSTDHMSSRKAEFTQLVNQQLADGLYEYKRIHRKYLDETDDSGKEITTFATEIVYDTEGNPKISQPSPLATFGINVTQFSIEDTDYDPQTLKQFAAKKESLLAAEQSKAERKQEVEKRLMVIEKGLREKAEVTAAANKERATQVINAEREKEVAELHAARGVAVAEQTKLEAETKAAQLVSVAALELDEQKLKTQSANERAEQVRLLAAAEEERITRGGAVTEQEKVLAQIMAQRDVDVARELAKIPVPHVVIGGGGGNSQGGGATMDLVNMLLLRSNGLLDVNSSSTAVDGANPGS